MIAVSGAEEVARHLDELLPGITVQGRPAEVRRITRSTDLDRVHILYIGAEALVRTRDLRAAAADRPILLVTDGENGLSAGGVINFGEADRKVRFEVSLPAADRARLRIDSALLAVAERVESQPRQGGGKLNHSAELVSVAWHCALRLATSGSAQLLAGGADQLRS